MLGRRGPVQAKWTTKELRELGELENADIDIDPAQLELDAASAAEAEGDRATTRNLELLQSFAAIVKRHLAKTDGEAQVLGPTAAPLEKLKTQWRWHLLLKSGSSKTLREIVSLLQARLPRSGFGNISIEHGIARCVAGDQLQHRLR